MQVNEIKMDFGNFCLGLGNKIINLTHIQPLNSGFFQGFFRTVKRPQKLNLELSFETQSSHQSFSAVKMKLFELNL